MKNKTIFKVVRKQVVAGKPVYDSLLFNWEGVSIHYTIGEMVYSVTPMFVFDYYPSAKQYARENLSLGATILKGATSSIDTIYDKTDKILSDEIKRNFEELKSYWYFVFGGRSTTFHRLRLNEDWRVYNDYRICFDFLPEREMIIKSLAQDWTETST